MLFSSYEFLLLFLPVTMAGFALARRWGTAAGQGWLLACSAIFYTVWNAAYLGLLTASIAGNYLLGLRIATLPRDSRAATPLLVAGVAANLGLLGYFKYAGFLVEIAAAVSGAPLVRPEILLPLAISFFTFQQIAFLVDVARTRTPPGAFLSYALFVLFFPQLIAGPIVHYGELKDQFRDAARFRLRWSTTATGLAYFVAGLVKKVVLADALAPTADAVFDTAAAGTALTAADAWRGTLAYSLQLYFDFSGYSDMAIGLGWLFGIRLPANFAAPYQAVSIADFWRRWHMTLSRFLRDYLYIPLGGNRCGALRRSCNLLVTMLLGGLWHGAGWTFLAWGGLHGLYLVGHAGWHVWCERTGWRWRHTLGGRIAARLLTLLAVMLGWVVFRAADLATAGRIFAALVGAGPAAGHLAGELATFWLLAGLLAFVQVIPHTQRLIGEGTVNVEMLPRPLRGLAWRPTPLRGAVLAIGLLVCLSLLTRVQEFLYFQF